MTGGNQLIDQIHMDLRDVRDGRTFTVHINVFDNSLSRKWLTALNQLLAQDYHLEKNYCFLGFVESTRHAEYICGQINQSITAINQAQLGYHIDDDFSVGNTITPGPVGENLPGGKLVHEKLNWLHRYFEDLQGVSGAMSPYYDLANDQTRWHIRQLNLLCHEYESLVLSMRKHQYVPQWRRPSQLMCWLHAPRFTLDQQDFQLFGVDSLARPLGGVFVGVNKAVGKHHWEVFNDEGRDSRVDELVSTSMRSQTEAAGDFDIEWANDPGQYHWMQTQLADFRSWLLVNGFDPEDKSLTIGHPQVGQVDLMQSFGTTEYQDIWKLLGDHLDVFSIRTSDTSAVFDYHWSDADYMQQQVAIIGDNRK